MTVESAIDLARDAALLTLVVGAPILLAGMVVGLVISMLQAVTQVQEQTLSFVPKIIAMVIVMMLVLPWMMARMLDYTENLIRDIPAVLFS
jgi:flagellar biosynthetic protein FliQ